ncbi:MAG TPA: bacterial transcriptional activator domain-containing protein, partial [Herpetosiphonaceae bacterium]
APPVAAPLLRLRLLGRIEACWLGRPVLLPRHGAELLALLALAGPAGISGDDLRDRLYGDPAASPHGLRKLLERVRKLMPGVVALDGAAYRLALPAGQLQADLLTVRETPLACQSLEELELAASLAGQPLLPGSEEPWVLGERETLRRRAVELWLALADLARERHAFELAVRAYQEARALSPLHERAVASSLRLNLDLGRHAEAVSVFLEYRSLLDDMLGLNPSPVVELLYKQALGA